MISPAKKLGNLNQAVEMIALSLKMGSKNIQNLWHVLAINREKLVAVPSCGVGMSEVLPVANPNPFSGLFPVHAGALQCLQASLGDPKLITDTLW